MEKTIGGLRLGRLQLFLFFTLFRRFFDASVGFESQASARLFLLPPLRRGIAKIAPSSGAPFVVGQVA